MNLMHLTSIAESFPTNWTAMTCSLFSRCLSLDFKQASTLCANKGLTRTNDCTYFSKKAFPRLGKLLTCSAFSKQAIKMIQTARLDKQNIHFDPSHNLSPKCGFI